VDSSGAPAGFENTLSRAAWSKEDGGKRVAVGGADRTVTIWDVENTRVLYKVYPVLIIFVCPSLTTPI
jgi:Prp8 binding protein